MGLFVVSRFVSTSAACCSADREFKGVLGPGRHFVWDPLRKVQRGRRVGA